MIARKLAAAAVAVIAVAGLSASAHGASTGRTEYMPCGQEGDNNCVWDAKTMGNGVGRSYFVGRDGRVWYLPHHVAHFLIFGN